MHQIERNEVQKLHLVMEETGVVLVEVEVVQDMVLVGEVRRWLAGDGEKLDFGDVAAQLDLRRRGEVLRVLVHTPEERSEHELTSSRRISQAAMAGGK